jgi:uncharacterized protein
MQVATVDKWANFLVDKRGILSFLSVLALIGLCFGMKNLYFNSDYRVFFEDDNPQLLAHQHTETTFTRSDPLMIYVSPSDGDVFTKDTLEAIREITEDAWGTPYALRVDSLTNYQHSRAEGDELIVKDLVDEDDILDQAFLQKTREIALTERETYKRLVSATGDTTVITISLDLPESFGEKLTEEQESELRHQKDQARFQVVAKGEEIIKKLHEIDPGMQVHLNGQPVINLTFEQASQKDVGFLLPLMYLVIILLLAAFLRSFTCVLGAVVVIGAATAGAVGFAGWVGYFINQLVVISPMVILTIAVCDCVHLLIIYLHKMSSGEDKVTAMKSSLSINFQPIVLTSVTTAIGFGTLNFAHSPPSVMLGNICGFGVLFAMVLTFTLLPGIVLALTRKQRLHKHHGLFTDQIANIVVRHPWRCAIGALVLSLAFISQIPRNIINDDVSLYFKDEVPLMASTTFIDEHLPGGARNFSYTINCGKADCIHNPDNLKKLEAFTLWFEQQPGVVYVSSYIDIIKKLNKNLNSGDDAFYRLPESRELAAQYHLLYELSLPYGLDLNNLVNVDKSSTKVIVFADNINSVDFINLDESAQAWFEDHAPEMKTAGSSITMMFAHVGLGIINSMKWGSLIALLGITFTILIAIRSVKYGLISLLPNAFPAAIALGIWGMLIGTVNQAIALVFSITLGIVVDNTVHFVSKYLRARRELNASAEEAIRYAFRMVGNALIVTTASLSIGFGLLWFSDFNVNAYLGAMVAITILSALAFDFMFLPALLLLVDRRHENRQARLLSKIAQGNNATGSI